MCPSLSPRPDVPSKGRWHGAGSPVPLAGGHAGGVRSWPMQLPAQGQDAAPAKSPVADQPREVIGGDREEELSRGRRGARLLHKP